MQYYPFDSRNKIYREHIGAVAAGEALRLRLLLHDDARVHTAYLRLKRDGEPDIREIELTPREMLEAYRYYDCEISLETGLYWYTFRYTSDYGEFFVTKTESSLGIVSADGDWWQQTVYDADFATPDWLDGGIIYQIFPDRFYNSGKEKQDVPQDRFLCSDWRRPPEHRQNNGICSLGNDYYCGDLAGITEKLPYIKSLGVSCIYLNPVFEAHSNHRYNTADYMKIDPLLGSEQDLEELCRKAREMGIAVILDGVFSHTGDDSRYFDRCGRYGGHGAYNDYNSFYRNWYKFGNFPTGYSAWWGVPSLPETNEDNPDFSEFITGENGVLRYWLKKGISGWRLDVADELPDSFLDKVRTAVKTEKADAFILGEVWEDASNKTSYGSRRRFLLGRQLDSVMNYPFANGIVEFVKNGNAEKLNSLILDILENYPMQCVKSLMNHIGTHDTARIITRLAAKDDYVGDREWQSHRCISLDEYNAAVKKLKCAAVLQYTLPGVPSLFYGDEAGLQGYGDPFCRATYPWGGEDKQLLEFYRALGALRSGCDAFKSGEFVPISAENGMLCFERKSGKVSVIIAVNCGCGERYIDVPSGYKAVFGERENENRICLPESGYAVLQNDI